MRKTLTAAAMLFAAAPNAWGASQPLDFEPYAPSPTAFAGVVLLSVILMSGVLRRSCKAKRVTKD